MPGEPIENHAIVGDQCTVALVGLDGTIDFMCWPRFDSPSIFAALLDQERGGSFTLAPLLDGARRRQLYLPDTNVLLTRFMSADGVAEISDFMPIASPGRGRRLIRRVKTVRGNIRFRACCDPRFDYGRADHGLAADGDTLVFTSQGADRTALRLRPTVPMRAQGGQAVAEFELAAGSSAAFILEDAEDGEDSPATAPDYVSDAFKATSDYWRHWVGRSTYRGRWRDLVSRSALALKLLTSAEHGSIIAAATFGLPEEIGGSRNWDYRFTWIRDAAFSLYALIRLGHYTEATAFMSWLSARAMHSPKDGTLQVMYGLDGRERLDEEVLPHLRGYRGSVPVRIGNAAYDQLQLDIYGELMDAVYLADKFAEPIGYQAWQGVTRGLNWVGENWQRPDEGIWEVRGGRREFLHSRLMCWVALDRGIRLARKRSLPAPLAQWSDTRDLIYRDIHEHFWNEQRQSFVQSKGGTALDAACLLMPLVRFIGPTDKRWLATLKAIGDELVDDSLVYRYSAEAESDGLQGKEGTFTMCSFWYVECLARSGDLAQARFLFEKIAGYANHVGLYSEEIGPAGEHLGNFPQAFTHLSMISAAHYLDRALTAAGMP